MRHAQFILLAALAATPLLQPLPAWGQMDSNAAEAVIDQYAAVLRNGDATQNARNESARRLANLGTPSAVASLRNALTDPGSPGGRIAAANAVPMLLTQEPVLIDPLLAIMESTEDRILVQAAAEALASYSGLDEIGRIMAVAQDVNRPDWSRVAAINALAAHSGRRIGDDLAALSDAPSAEVSQAAGAALQAMMDVPPAPPAQLAQAWRRQFAPLDDNALLERLLNASSRREALLRQRSDRLRLEALSKLNESMKRLPPEQQPAMLSSYLDSSEPAIRKIGLELVYLKIGSSGRIDAAVRDRVRSLIADSSPEVRLKAAETIALSNDRPALQQLLAQIAVEPVPDVKAAQVKTLGPIQDPAAAATVISLLQDQSPQVAEAAARSLQNLASVLLQSNQAMALTAGRSLMSALDRPEPNVRVAAAAALVPLAGRWAVPRLRDLLDVSRQEPSAIRRSAVAAFATVNEEQASDLIAGLVNDADPGVRLEAIRTLGKISTFAYAPTIELRLYDRNEVDPAVRDQAWQTLRQMFHTAPAKSLLIWENKFQDQPARQIDVYKVLAAKAEAAGDTGDLISRLNQVGDLQIKRLNQPAEAVDTFKRALDVAQRKGNVDNGVLEALYNGYLQSLLQAGRPSEAIQFAQTLLKDNKSNHDVVVSVIKQELERLRQAEQFDKVKQLIDMSLAMNPQLSEPTRAQLASDLKQAQRDLERRQRQGSYRLPATAEAGLFRPLT